MEALANNIGCMEIYLIYKRLFKAGFFKAFETIAETISQTNKLASF